MSILNCLKGQNFTHELFRSIHYDEKDLIFFIMPFKRSHNDLFINYIKPLIEKEFQLKVEIATDRFTTRGFIEKIWQQICESRIVIADITEWRPNVFYELSLAHALSKKCIHITRKESSIPSDLRHIDTIIYSYSIFKRNIPKLQDELIRAISHALDRIKVADFSNWRQTKGIWLVRNKELELDAQSITPSAFYIWNPNPFSQYLNIKFRLKFIKPSPLDFRISLFASNTFETYENSNHLLFIFPWEHGGHRVDELVKSKPSQIWHSNALPLISGQLYSYEITVDSQQVIVKIDGIIIYQEAIQRFQQFLIKQAHWGFSSVGGHFVVSDLETVVR